MAHNVAQLDGRWIVIADDSKPVSFDNAIGVFETYGEAIRAALSFDPDKETIAEAFRMIATAAMQINEVLGRRDDLNDAVPKDWPLNLSADEFAAECWHMADLYNEESDR